MLDFKRFVLSCVAILCLSFTFAAYAVSDFDLAFYHAPVHYQDTDSTHYPSDYITAIDYDFDWVANNNWDNLGGGLWPATVLLTRRADLRCNSI